MRRRGAQCVLLARVEARGVAREAFERKGMVTESLRDQECDRIVKFEEEGEGRVRAKKTNGEGRKIDAFENVNIYELQELVLFIASEVFALVSQGKDSVARQAWTFFAVVDGGGWSVGGEITNVDRYRVEVGKLGEEG